MTYLLTKNKKASSCFDAVIVCARYIRHPANIQPSVSQRDICNLQLQKIHTGLSSDERVPILTCHDQLAVPIILNHSPIGCYVRLANETCHHTHHDCIIGRRLEEGNWVIQAETNTKQKKSKYAAQ